MKPEYEQLFAAIKEKHSALIAETDANPDKWYELFVTHSDKEGTESIDSGDTFDEAVQSIESHLICYDIKSLAVDIWVNRDNPSPLCFGFQFINCGE